MIDWMTIATEMGILGFFALLYYLFQSRKITRHYHDKRVDAYALWIYDYHHYLDEIKDKPEYEKLNQFVTQIEQIELDSPEQRQELINHIPVHMDEELKSRLIEILED